MMNRDVVTRDIGTCDMMNRADFSGISSALVAVSGGVDSAVLLHLANEAGIRVEAACVVSEFTAECDLSAAREAAAREGTPFHEIHVSFLEDDAISANTKDRCYLCKKKMASLLCSLAKTRGLSAVLEGTNADDGVRPGLRALQEAGILSPLRNLSKSEIVTTAENAGIPVPPPSSCLASRIPQNTRIAREKLLLAEAAEETLRRAGVLGILRVRISGAGNEGMVSAAVEVEREFMKPAVFFEEKLKPLGIQVISLHEYKTGGA
ncbi:MAG TPA: 7-cyano-7-deazaguanine synthase [Methanocorpusculum sp.]|nr:7-cyano-7-deazaguanine synthase [Candidatus Methanocorpusculum equi]MCQ2357828.1 7-cyano-7-deazaguanine synthase [Methanocorpusculum sp.]HJJ33009.1 7-cyano-7-deazaguanine synthase [Methanocorpusculum sp.]HJJ44674.1 7-cyano-7-deazaguanine synthase [Methanocorpusculum sp.]HJJ59626.1 7-cyano-7-deazaguanine synthase [Methanocorpusculum sp.]